MKRVLSACALALLMMLAFGATTATAVAVPADSDDPSAGCLACHGGVTHASSSWTLLGCGGDGCHTTSDLLPVHTEQDAAFTCDDCHSSTSQAVQTAIANRLTGCGDCHLDLSTSVHHAAHVAQTSQECVGCHETGDAIDLHASADAAPCLLCHGLAALPESIECVNCHELSPVDPNHYPLAAHAASFGTGCGTCHYADMKTEHFKPTVSVSCVACHEAAVDALVEPWDKTCEACHSSKHDSQFASHASSVTACGGGNCHVIADAAAVHSGVADGGCGVCHTGPDQPAATTDCSVCHGVGGHELREPMSACASSGCHSVVEVHGASAHSAAECDTCHGDSAPGCVGGSCHDLTAVHSQGAHADAGCTTCHTSGISKPHETVTSKLTSDSAWRTACDSCHGRSHSYGSCSRCHGLGQRKDVHAVSRHTDNNSDCVGCHNVAVADRDYQCVLCHPAPSSASPWGGGSWGGSHDDGGSWGR
jgi:hypothetical protein